MKVLIHRAAAVGAFGMVLLFWSSTLVSEFFLDLHSVAIVKRAVAYALPVLIVLLITTGATGARLATGRTGRLLGAKRRRMRVVAATGMLVMLPAALFLHALASRGSFDGRFYAIQAVELIAGASQIALMALNARDGLRLSRGRGHITTAHGASGETG
ncbi:MAG: hypothetical protein H7Y33_03675 [Cytophagales bacterium]|nr:hypothetical protein [Rhizobacter sp.]